MASESASDIQIKPGPYIVASTSQEGLPAGDLDQKAGEWGTEGTGDQTVSCCKQNMAGVRAFSQQAELSATQDTCAASALSTTHSAALDPNTGITDNIQSHGRGVNVMGDLNKDKGRNIKGQCHKQSLDCLRIVMIGKTGSGKSVSANTILGRKKFISSLSQTSVTKICQKEWGAEDGRVIFVVDTPGLFDSTMSNDEVSKEMVRCISHLAPGPHVFLLVLQLGRFTPEEKETLKLIKKAFGEGAEKFIMILLTHGDDLDEEELTIEEFIRDKCDAAFKKFISDCGGRYHVFNNKEKKDRTQVKELIKKIDNMVMKNGGSCYTNKMLQKAEEAIKKEEERILKEKEEERRREREKKEEEIRRAKEEAERKYKKQEEEMKKLLEKERQKREKELKENTDKLKAEQERRKMEEEMRQKAEQIRKEQEEQHRREMEKLRRRQEEQAERDAEKARRDAEEARRSAEERYARENTEKEGWCSLL